MRELQRDFGTAIIMITHDLGVVAGLCDQVLVLYGGQVMEQGPAESIFYRPSHPYTAGLLAAVPKLDGGDAPMVAIPGTPPNMAQLPPGCPFTERCGLALPQCASIRPVLGPAPTMPRCCGLATRVCKPSPEREESEHVDYCLPGRHRAPTPPFCARLARALHHPRRRAMAVESIAHAESGGWRIVLTSTPAKRWAWLASRAAANPPWRAHC